jgi:hypothetical protein
VRSEGDGTESVTASFLWTPNRRETRRSVDKFFRDIASTLTRLENLGGKTYWVAVMVNDVGELGPTSYFLEALCAFLRENAFAVAGERTYVRPLRLTVEVVAELGADDVDRSDPALAEATSRICRAFWENERFRAAAVVNVDVPAAPSPEALDAFFRGRTRNTTMRDSPRVTIRVTDRPDQPGNDRDMLLVEVGGLRIVGEKSPHAAAVADAVLGSAFPDVTAGLCVWFFSPDAAAAFTTSLRGRGNHGFPHIAFFVGEPRDTGIVEDAPGVAEPPPRPAAFDMAGLCGAVLRCPAVNFLAFEGFNFTAAAVAVAREAASGADPPAAVLSLLTFSRCTFSDPVHGFCSLAAAMSPRNKLLLLCLLGTSLHMRDMAALSSILGCSDCPINTLALGDALYGESERCLNDACVQHFFQMLPSMKRLKSLMFRCSVPAHMSRTVVDGIKNNYSLRRVMEMTFGTAQLQGEAESYTTANGNGREDVFEAVANPGNRPLLERAIGVLHRLSNSEEQGDATTLYLCLQLFLPFCCGDLRIARARCWL